MATRKQITFDLNTTLMRVYYPKENWRKGYDDIRRYMKEQDFEWLQGSVYVSKKTMSYTEVARTIRRLVATNNWLNICMRDCAVTNVGKTFDLNDLFNKNAKIPKREEPQTQKTTDYDMTI